MDKETIKKQAEIFSANESERNAFIKGAEWANKECREFNKEIDKLENQRHFNNLLHALKSEFGYD